MSLPTRSIAVTVTAFLYRLYYRHFVLGTTQFDDDKAHGTRKKLWDVPHRSPSFSSQLWWLALALVSPNEWSRKRQSCITKGFYLPRFIKRRKSKQSPFEPENNKKVTDSFIIEKVSRSLIELNLPPRVGDGNEPSLRCAFVQKFVAHTSRVQQTLEERARRKH